MVNSNVKSFKRFWASINPEVDSEGFLHYTIYKGVLNPQVICTGSCKTDNVKDLQERLDSTIIKRLNNNSVKTFAEANANFV